MSAGRYRGYGWYCSSSNVTSPPVTSSHAPGRPGVQPDPAASEWVSTVVGGVAVMVVPAGRWVVAGAAVGVGATVAMGRRGGCGSALVAPA